MTNVVALPGIAAGKEAPPVAEVIGRLEAALERARKGELRAFALVSVASRGVVGSEWCECDGWFHEINSGLATLHYRFLKDNSGAS